MRRARLFLIASWSLALGLVTFCSGWASDVDPEAEQQVVRELNQARREHGLSPLAVNDKLIDAAREHSKLLAKHKQLSHQFSGEPPVPEREAATGLHFSYSGENVGFNTDLDDVHPAFMRSPPHRANILSPNYDSVGVGIIRNKDAYWVTEDFAHVIREQTQNDVEGKVAAAIEKLQGRGRARRLKRIDSAQLRSIACNLARKEKLDPKAPFAVEGVHTALTYTNSDPAQLPDNARQIVLQQGLSGYAVGACFGKAAGGAGGTYYVVVAFF